jgi:GTPase SAR1 family protein
MTAAKAPFAKMTNQIKNSRPLRIMVLGQGGVGKSGDNFYIL